MSIIKRSSLWIVFLVVFLSAIPFVCGKYLEFNTNGAFDGGLNVYSAQCIVNGRKLDVEVFPSARPATLLVNVVGVAVFGFSEFGPKLIQTFMQLLAFAVMFYTLRRLYGNLPAAVALLMAAFYLSCPPFAKFGNVKEQFMIVCMIVSVCAFILRYLDARRWYLLVCAAAAVNAYYFKPTGLSVVIAIGAHLLAQLLLRRYHWRNVGADLLWLLFGAGIGLVPLALFYLWQGRLGGFLGQFPAAQIVFALKVYVVFLLAVFAIRRFDRRWVRLRLIVILSGVVVVVFALTSLYITIFFEKGQLSYYLKGIFFIHYPLMLMHRVGIVWDGMVRIVCESGDYLTGSREVSVFRSQYDWVVRYYRYLVVPIGLSLMAIFWSFYRFAVERFRSKGVNPKETCEADRFVLLLAMWWILDMLFIWISPRSYVEYFLPMSASAAMLGAYVVCRCLKNPPGLLWLAVVWLFLDLMLRWIVPAGHLPFVGFRLAESVGEYWGQFIVKLLLVAAAVLVWAFLKKKRIRSVPTVVAVLLCCVMCLWWNADNLTRFNERLGNLRDMRRVGGVSAWEQIAHYIRDRSLPDDGLYVWGWYPGIYVQAGRFCPAAHPAYSDMHTNSPEVVGEKIEKLVDQLRAEPPLFIVDSQKPHFPFYDHPVFDLWPRWRDRKKNAFQFRYHQGQPLRPENFLAPAEWSSYRDLNLAETERYSLFLLTRENRRGGPLPREKARQLAELERRRHTAMEPLRKFVMNNYQPIPLRASMFVFKLKK